MGRRKGWKGTVRHSRNVLQEEERRGSDGNIKNMKKEMVRGNRMNDVKK